MRPDRHSRQIRLAEVGVAGQARIEHAEAVVRGADGADVEREYLLRAGVGSIRVEADAPAEPFAHAAAFRFGAARDVASGAWRALGVIRAALRGQP